MSDWPKIYDLDNPHFVLVEPCQTCHGMRFTGKEKCSKCHGDAYNERVTTQVYLSPQELVRYVLFELSRDLEHLAQQT